MPTDSSVTTYTLTPSAPPKLVTLPPGKKGEAISIDPAAARGQIFGWVYSNLQLYHFDQHFFFFFYYSCG